MKNLIKPASLAIALFAAHAYAAPLAINFSEDCEGGGKRTTAGSFDATSGAIDITVTLASCVGRPPQGKGAGDKAPPPNKDAAPKSADNAKAAPTPPSATGTESIKGVFLEASGSYTLDLTEAANVKLTFDSTHSMTRQCTVLRKGTFDSTTNLFTGTINRKDCSMSGSYPERLGVVEHILRHALSTEGL